MNDIRILIKNTSFILIAQIFSLIIGFVYTIFIARYLGVESYGILSFALALVGILGIFADLGLTTLMTREIAKDKLVTPKYLNNIISLKIIILLIIVTLTVFIVNFIGIPERTIYVIYFLLLYLIFNTIILIFYSLFQAYEHLEYQSFALVINNTMMFLGVFLLIQFNLNVIGFAALYSIVNGIVMFYVFFLSYKKFILPKIEFDWEFNKQIIPLGLQFGLIGIFSTLYVWVDSIILSFIQGNAAVGIYSAAYNLVLILLFIPVSVNLAIFPLMSRWYGSSNNSLEKIVEKYFKIMLLIGIPMSILVTLLSKDIILLIYGVAYSKSIVALQILIWASTFTFANAAFVQLFKSTNRQMLVAKITAICLIVNVTLNLIFIPKFSYIAASYNTLLTEFLVVMFLIISANKLGYIRKKRIITYIIRIIGSSLIMGLSIILLKGLNIFILVFLAIIIYTGILYITRTLDAEDIKIIKELIKMIRRNNSE